MTVRALVLSGGGARGAYQVGMLRELVCRRGLDFTVIRGVSIGSLNAAFLAQAPTGTGSASMPAASSSRQELARRVERLEALWTEQITGNDSLYRKRLFGAFGLLLGAESVYSLRPLHRLVRRNLSFKAVKESGRSFGFGTVSLASGRYFEVSSDPERRNAGDETEGRRGSTERDRRIRLGSLDEDEFFDRLVASSSLPGFFPLVRTRLREPRRSDDGRHEREPGEPESSERKDDGRSDGGRVGVEDTLIDGGAREITPLSSAFRAHPEPDEIYVLLSSRVVAARENEIPKSAVATYLYQEWRRKWRIGLRSTGIRVLRRAYDIFSDEVYLDDIRTAIEWNQAVAMIEDAASLLDECAAAAGAGGQAAAGGGGEAASGAGGETASDAEAPARKLEAAWRQRVGKRRVKIHVIAPRVWFDEEAVRPDELNPALKFSPHLIHRAIEHGSHVAADEDLWLYRSP